MMKKPRISGSIKLAAMLLVVMLLALTPLLGVACDDDDDDDGNGKAPVAAFSATPQTGEPPLVVQFTDESTGEPTAWEWDLNGDGETDSTDQNPSFTYNEVGIYDITLKVVGADGENTKKESSFVNVTETTIEWESMELTMANHMAQDDPQGLSADKLKELIEAYTDGKVTVNVHHNQTLIADVEMFPGLQTGALDMAILHPGYLRGYSANLDPLGAIPGLPQWDIEWTLDCIESDQLLEILRAEFDSRDVQLLGYVESVIIAGYLSTLADFDDNADLEGALYAQYRAGPLDPVEDEWGAIAVPVATSEIPFAIQNGDVQVVPMPPVNAWTTGMYQMFQSYLLRAVYAPAMALISGDTWDDMQPELQVLLTDTIYPELWDYSQEVATNAAKEALKSLTESGMNMSMTTPEDDEVSWDMIQDNSTFLDRKDQLDPEMLQIMEDLKPAESTWAPVIYEMLDYAGIPY
ncbi:TRAP transporter substrate-binding protein DctP [Chloroflexota bacterium]